MEREEHHHRPDNRNQCDARWINRVSFVSIFWYNLNGFLNVENVRQFYFPPAKKAQMTPGGWCVDEVGYFGVICVAGKV